MNPTVRTALITILCVLSVSLYAVEPEGFRGISWGQSPKLFSKELVPFGKDGLLDVYTRKNDKLKIGGAAIERITYHFWDSEFMSAVIETEGIVNKNSLLQALTEKYGKPDMSDYRGILWSGGVMVMCNSVTDDCVTQISSSEIEAKKSSHEAGVARKAVDDF